MMSPSRGKLPITRCSPGSGTLGKASRPPVRGASHLRRVSLGSGGVPILVVFAFMTGCGPLIGTQPPSQPAPSSTPSPSRPGQPPAPTPVQLPTPQPGRAAVALEPITETTAVDPILDSPWARASDMEVRIQGWVESFQTREASLFRTTLARMGR